MQHSRPALLFSSLAIGFGFSFVLGFYAHLVFAPYRMPVYMPEFLHAAWIEAAPNKPTAYYRYSLVLTDTPNQAQIVVAAPDGYQLYVNGQKVAENEFISVQASGVHDIAPLLLPGKNIIAVGVIRKTYPGTASLIAEGFWESPLGGGGRIATGSEWRAATEEQWQRNGELSWKDRDFDDTSWSSAKVINPLSPLVYSPLLIAPEFLARLRIGKWIWLPEMNAKSGSFYRPLDIRGRTIESAWLGVATTASYSITINNKIVAAANPTREYLDAYNIAPFLLRGENTLEISVSSRVPGGQLAIAGVVVVDGQLTTLPSGPDWRAHSGDVVNVHTTTWSTPSEHASVRPIEHKLKEPNDAVTIAILHHPFIRFMESNPPSTGMKTLREPALWSALSLAVNGLGLVLFTSVYRKLHRSSMLSAVSVYVAPQLVGLLILVWLLLARFDVRFDPAALVDARVLVVVCLAIVLWLLAVLLEVSVRDGAGENIK
jgi:multisubunit Na+/H+ antiporter MnhG subunit